MRLTRLWRWPLLSRGRRPQEDAAEADPQPAAPDRGAEPPTEPEGLLVRMGNLAWRVLLIGVVIAFVVYGLVYIRVVTIPVILAIFVTALLTPPANWLRRKGLGRGTSTAITCVGALVLLAGVVTMVVQPAISGFSGLVDSVEQAVDDLPSYLQTFGLDPQLASTAIDAVERELRSRLQEDWSQWVSQAWVAGTTVLEILLGVILILVLTIYFVHSGDLLMEWLRSLFPRASRRSIKAATEISYGVMGRYVRGVALVGLIDAIGIGLFLVFLIDPSLAIPLIVLTFIGAFLPVIGAFLTGLLAALVALVTQGWLIAVLVVAVVVVVQQLESHVFAPRVYGKALELPSAVVLLVITIGGILGGIAGMFLATPVVAVIAALLRNRPLARAAETGRFAGAGGRPDDVAAGGSEAGATGDKPRSAHKTPAESGVTAGRTPADSAGAESSGTGKSGNTGRSQTETSETRPGPSKGADRGQS
ncbi:AI-2E family transporter [Streptomonospora litoralis]|uniref:Pheromone autoinducer 2 transporter n=1 Tax=Streptomonospora litoralis TaxID=2498135 RepID=A0A4P6Q3B5_9ACTN|nr:AI-2E family transporter [Streptomonospora litoralis]QBI54670.1 pheromone autoinducer 2 transporter [Streptomonospora litoralis]